jgi:pSer/pThr/pTyr-binding forkhead associated (FHA) protein
MKLSLVVTTPGKNQGKAIPITLSQFLIGRDKQCHMRPASPIISNRHCAILVKGNKAFVRDFESTNGTFINDKQVKGQQEIRDDDKLRIGPMEFKVSLEATPAAAKPAEAVDDDAMAAMLLAVPDDNQTPGKVLPLDSEGVPAGETVMDLMVPGVTETDAKKPEAAKPPPDPKKEDTAAVADSLLQKYLRRGPR